MVPYNFAKEIVSKMPKGDLPCGYAYEFPLNVGQIFWGKDLENISSKPNVRICTEAEKLDHFLTLHYILCKGAEVAQALSSLGGVGADGSSGEKNGGEK